MRRSSAPGFVSWVAAAALAAATIALAVRKAPGEVPGWTFVLLGPERWLATAGFGLALGAMRRDRRPVAIIALLAGFALGFLLRHSELWTWLASPSVYPRLHLLGPAACVLSGLLLVLRPPWRSLASPFVGMGVGAALMLTAAINDPNPDGLAFGAQAGIASLWLMLGAATIRRLADRPWISLGERIAGSWLLAIGVLLGGVQFAPAPDRTIAVEQPAAPSTAPPRGAVPDIVLRPGNGPAVAPFGDRGMPRGTN